MSSHREYDDEKYSAASQDGAEMTGGMDNIPSRPPPQTSPKKHRRQSTGHKDHYEDDGDHHDYDDGKSNVSARSDVSERTRNTWKIIRDASFSPKSGPYNPYADLPIQSPSTTQAPTPRSTTRHAHLEVETTHYQSDRLRPPPSGASRKSEDPGQEYSRSPGDRRVHYENAGRPPPSGPTRSRGSRDDTPSRAYVQSTTSPDHSPGDMTGSDPYGLRFPKVQMPQLEDYVVPSASAKNTPQYGGTSPRDQRPALPSGYTRPSHLNTAADYADARVQSPSTQDRVAPRRTSRGSYPGGDDYPRESRASASSASPTNTRHPYQATSPREGTTSPISSLSAPRQRYSPSPTGPGRPDPYLAQVARATEHEKDKSRKDSGMSRPIDMPGRPKDPNRLSASSQGYGISNPRSPLGRMPVRTFGDKHSPPGVGSPQSYGQSQFSPTNLDGRQRKENSYFASRSPNSYSSPIDPARPHPKAVYEYPFEEESKEEEEDEQLIVERKRRPRAPASPASYEHSITGLQDEQLIIERERQPRVPASPASHENSITDLRLGHPRKLSGTYTPLLSPRAGSGSGTPRSDGSADSRAEEIDARLESLRIKREAMRKARETNLSEWQTRMTKKMPTHRRDMQEELRTDFRNSADLHRCLKDFGWKLGTAIEKNEEPIANLSLDFTDAYNNHVAEIYKKYLDQGNPGLPSEDIDFVTSTKVREGKRDWSGLIEAPGCRVTTEFTLTIAGGKHTEPVTRQRRQVYDDLRATISPPEIFVPTIGIEKLKRSEPRDGYPDRSDRRQNRITYNSKYDGGGRSNEIVAYDSKNPDRSEREEGSVVSSRGRGRRAYEEVPREGTLLLVPGIPQRRGNSTTTKYRYDKSQPPSGVGTREPSEEPPSRGSRLPSGAASWASSRPHSREPSRPPTRAASKHRQKRKEGGGEPSRNHRSRTERTESEERDRDARQRRRKERRPRN